MDSAGVKLVINKREWEGSAISSSTYSLSCLINRLLRSRSSHSLTHVIRFRRASGILCSRSTPSISLSLSLSLFCRCACAVTLLEYCCRTRGEISQQPCCRRHRRTVVCAPRLIYLQSHMRQYINYVA